MALSIIAKWCIEPGCDQHALAALGGLAESVEQNEPFTAMYLIHPSDPGVPRQWPRVHGSHNELDFSQTPPRQHVPSLGFLTGV